jgi:hypothetical protein
MVNHYVFFMYMEMECYKHKTKTKTGEWSSNCKNETGKTAKLFSTWDSQRVHWYFSLINNLLALFCKFMQFSMHVWSNQMHFIEMCLNMRIEYFVMTHRQNMMACKNDLSLKNKENYICTKI